MQVLSYINTRYTGLPPPIYFILHHPGGCHYDSGHPDRLGVASHRVNVFEMESHQWIPVAPMKEARAYHTAAAWRNNVYVAGGETRSGR